MGLNLCVYRIRDGKLKGEAPHAQWDSGRYSGDRDFASEVLADKEKSEARRLGDDYDIEWYYRPRDVAAWKQWDAAYGHNNGRWAALADLLAADPELWIYQST